MRKSALTNVESIPYQNLKFPIRFFYETINDANRLSIHWHDDLELIKVLSGNASYIINGVTYNIQEGDIIIINPKQIHQAWSTGPKSLRCKVIQLSYDIVRTQMSDIMTEKFIDPFSKSNHIFHNVIRSTELLALFDSLQKEIVDKPYLYEINTKVKVLNIITFLLRNGLFYINDSYNKRRKESLNIVRKAVEYLQQNYHTNISLDDVSHICNITKYHLCHIFKENTHMTINQYLTNYRLKESTRLLKETKMNINAVSEAAGFNSPSYFIKKFKEEYNIPPNQYRKL